jgi:transcription elongation factor GreA
VVVVDIQKAGLEMVGLGSVVHIEVNGSKHEYTIVGEWEADPAAKKISHESPLGKALMGKKVGEAVEVEAPSGVITYAIKSVK